MITQSVLIPCTSLFGSLALLSSGDTFIVALHTINALCGFRKDELPDMASTGFAGKAGGVIRLVAGHDSFVRNGFFADGAVI